MYNCEVQLNDDGDDCERSVPFFKLLAITVGTTLFQKSHWVMFEWRKDTEWRWISQSW